jgi:hypothetical protein
MSMMDLMGGAPPEEAPPPEMGGDPMAALMGAAPGAAAPPEAPVEEAPAEGGDDETTRYKNAISELQAALEMPTTDEQEMAEIQKCIASLQGLLGKNEKMLDSALGTSPQLRKALAGGGA